MEELQNPFASHRPEASGPEDMPKWLFRITIATGLTSILCLVLAAATGFGAWMAWTATIPDLTQEDAMLVRVLLAVATAFLLLVSAHGFATTAGLFARARWAGYSAMLFALGALASGLFAPTALVLLLGILDPATQRALDCRLTVWD